jgi:N-acetylglucosaminyldiphosphoundecaprenol N-acetyl-beta-D-mannosaminyltransferase
MTSPAGIAPTAMGLPASPPTADVLGVALSLTDYERTLDWMDATIAASGRAYVCVAAVHTVMLCAEDAQFAAAVRDASLVVPDGQPLVWALRALGHRLTDRVYGPELMDRACARAARTRTRIFLYGGRDDDALAMLAGRLQERHPGLIVAGAHAPPFRPLTAAEEQAVADEINGSAADIVWVGIGVPKQEKWMSAMRERLHAPVLVGVGAAFDFHAGLVAQAPPRLQALGLEWAFRLSREPRRLWRRYVRYNPRFVVGFLRQYRAAHRRK